jgi:hypothetical protein
MKGDFLRNCISLYHANSAEHATFGTRSVSV